MVNSTKLFFFFSFLLSLLILSCGTESKKSEVVNHPSRIVLITPPPHLQGSEEATNDFKSLKRSLAVSGIEVVEIEIVKLNKAKLSSFDLIVVPQLTALSLDNSQIELISNYVTDGGKIFFDGTSPLATRLGIRFLDQDILVRRIRDVQSKDETLYWNVAATVNPIDTVGKSYKILCSDDSTHNAIVVKGGFSKGSFIFSSSLFDQNTDKGYSKFPFLVETLKNEFNIYSIANRAGSEMFMDLGDHDHDSWDSVANEWRLNKVKRIFASGWYYDNEDYDYKKLIDACHKNGIAVYCWLESPTVSSEFWDQHPNWREKTATLADAKIDWRQLMNLADENCRKQCFLELDSFLNAHDWDGVNLAELYFEPVSGFEVPFEFTPMNDWVRKDFEQKKSF